MSTPSCITTQWRSAELSHHRVGPPAESTWTLSPTLAFPGGPSPHDGPHNGPGHNTSHVYPLAGSKVSHPRHVHHLFPLHAWELCFFSWPAEYTRARGNTYLLFNFTTMLFCTHHWIGYASMEHEQEEERDSLRWVSWFSHFTIPPESFSRRLRLGGMRTHLHTYIHT